MTWQEETDALKHRIAKAQSDCDTWRVTGIEEKYLAAYVLVEALELQLSERLGQSQR